MKPKEIIIHHTASARDKTTIAQINAWHQARWPDFKSSLGYFVGYHLVITGDGTVTQTRKDTEMGAHTIPNNDKLGICLTGNFETEVPSEKQLNSLRTLLDKKKTEWGIDNTKIFGHKEKSPTACPGKSLFEWVKNYRSTQASVTYEKLVNINGTIYQKQNAKEYKSPEELANDLGIKVDQIEWNKISEGSQIESIWQKIIKAINK
jgi:hypothetical protein